MSSDRAPDPPPIVIIGAGPIGLAAAARLASRCLPFLVLERGSRPGASIREWAHVCMFSTWRDNVDPAARDLLRSAGWTPPPDDGLPTGGQFLEAWLDPLARHPLLAPHIRTNARVERVRAASAGRAESATFELVLASGEIVGARAVIDASGTWSCPKRLPQDPPSTSHSGGSSSPRYGIPDILGADRRRYAGREVLVIGSGHSAMNLVNGLAALRVGKQEGQIHWSLRSHAVERLFNPLPDRFPARANLEQAARSLIESGALTAWIDLDLRALERRSGRWRIEGRCAGSSAALEADEIVVASGFEPDLAMLGALRLRIDPDLKCVAGLADLLRSMPGHRGSIPDHGWRALAHPQQDFFIAGIKSFGSAPSFDLATGYKQVEAVVARLASGTQ
jgi:2-polyprenyl-6-methoxyphenol hydroxylase-like FAD-dependent oxidoreductase